MFVPMLRGYPKTDNGQCDPDFGREQGDAKGAILREACFEAATLLQAKRWIAMAVGSFLIASSQTVIRSLDLNCGWFGNLGPKWACRQDVAQGRAMLSLIVSICGTVETMRQVREKGGGITRFPRLLRRVSCEGVMNFSTMMEMVPDWALRQMTLRNLVLEVGAMELV